MMKTSLWLAMAGLMICAWTGCGDGVFHEPWREQKLPNGQSVKIKGLLMAWGVEHDEPRRPEQDCFVLQFVYNAPAAGAEAHEREAKDVFELIRPLSEQWGFTNAEVMAYATVEPDRHYDLFFFERGADGKWSTRLERH
jgi:hypothetical protein